MKKVRVPEVGIEGVKKALFVSAGIGAVLIGRKLFTARREIDLHGKVVLITGGSRGLGLALAREFAAQGSRLAICARHEHQLEEAKKDLERLGAAVLAIPCDVTDRNQVQGMITSVIRHYGRVDVLVNNAGVIQVGPVQHMEMADFENAMNVMFWGVVFPTLSLLPHMLRRRGTRIVNITSIGGKVSVPHLLPYTCAKFAAVAFSEGLQAELAGQNVKVVTIVPGLMRTGSYLNAQFKGDRESESTWFGLGSTLPLISMDVERAAREIVSATRRGEAERILSTPANLLARFHGAFPALATELLALVSQILLPSPKGKSKSSRRGWDIPGLRSSPWLAGLTILGRMAARRMNQSPGAR